MDLQNVSSLISSMIKKGETYEIYVLNTTLVGKPMYQVEDQWVRSYFKYGWREEDVDIELGLRPKFGGIRVFGDPIATIIHSVFFPRFSKYLGARPGFRAHVGSDDGRWLRPQQGRQLLVASYVRQANASLGHYAINLKKDFEAELLKREIDELMYNLKEVRIIDAPQVTIKRER